MEVYGQANQSISKLLRVDMSTSQLYRITDTIGDQIEDELKEGMPMLQVEPHDHVYAQMDGGVIFTDDGWQGVKVGGIFRQSDIEKQSQGTERQYIKESQYAAHIGHYPQFAEVFDKGLSAYGHLGKRLVFITDGAAWIHKWIKGSYPKALAILDFFHATEHVSKIGKLLIKAPDKFERWLAGNKEHLLNSRIDEVLDSIRNLKAETPEQVQEKHREIRSKYLSNY